MAAPPPSGVSMAPGPPWQPPMAPQTPIPPARTGPGPVVAVVAIAMAVVVVLALLMALLAIPRPVRTMTPSQFSLELEHWGGGQFHSQREFPGLAPGDTVRVSGIITDVFPIDSRSQVSLDGSYLPLSLTLPSSCSIGSRMTMTLHITQVTTQGRTDEGIEEIAISCS